MYPNKGNISNKRIAKNTVLLYLRMLVTMAVSLFTARIVLDVLGVENYGIYNVVAGVVVLFTFVNNAMAIGTQRHISYELGKIDGRVSELFSACFKIHIVLGVIVVFFGEVVGLWFLNYKLNIPADRMFAANVIYQIALVNCFISIVKTPYDASIIAYEKMSFYAYMSIFEAVGKLVLVYTLKVMPYDKLITYSSFILIVSTIGMLIQLCYIHMHLPEIKIVTIKDKKLYKYLLSFSGWTLFGSVAGMLETQGLNMIINIYFGVVLNAAVGIAGQVRGVLSQFVSGFQQALNPQLVMSESSGDRLRQFTLIFQSAKFSFFIMFALSLPVIANLNQILHLWLCQVPDYTVSICVLVIILQLFECISSPLYTTIFAIGKIQLYQVIVSLLRTLSVMSALAICSLHIEPYMIYLMPCIVAGLLLVYRIWFVHKQISMPVSSFIKQVISPVLTVCLVTIIPLFLYKQFMVSNDSFLRLIIETCCIAIVAIIASYTIGFTSSERAAVLQQIRKVIKK